MTGQAENFNPIQSAETMPTPPNEPENFAGKVTSKLNKVNISRGKIILISTLIFLLLISLTGFALLSSMNRNDKNKNTDVEVVVETKPSPKTLSPDEQKIEDFAKDLDSQTSSPNLDLPKLDYAILYK